MRKIVLLVGIFFFEAAMGQSTLESVRSKGYLQCGVNTWLAAFSQPDSRGIWARHRRRPLPPVAAAVFGDAQQGALHAAHRAAALHGRCSRARSTLLSRNTHLDPVEGHQPRAQLRRRNYYATPGLHGAQRLK